MAQLVEYDLAKVGVAGSSPVCRSKKNGNLYNRFPFFCITLHAHRSGSPIITKQQGHLCHEISLLFYYPTGKLILFFLHNSQSQLVQLLLVNQGRCFCHKI